MEFITIKTNIKKIQDQLESLNTRQLLRYGLAIIHSNSLNVTDF